MKLRGSEECDRYCSGYVDGFGLTTLKGGIDVLGTREIARLIAAMGGNELSAYGLCHLGDYEATVFSKFSHNRQFGESFYQRRRLWTAGRRVLYSESSCGASEKYQVELPISKAVYDIFYMIMQTRV